MGTRKRTGKANYEALKTLVIAFGSSEAARQAGLPIGTVTSLASRKGWKQAKPASQPTLATLPRSDSKPKTELQQLSSNPANALANALESLRNRSTLNLGKWTADAAEEAAKGKSKLGNAKRVRDVAAVHSTLWPAVQRQEILSLSLLAGDIQLSQQEPDK